MDIWNKFLFETDFENNGRKFSNKFLESNLASQIETVMLTHFPTQKSIPIANIPIKSLDGKSHAAVLLDTCEILERNGFNLRGIIQDGLAANYTGFKCLRDRVVENTIDDICFKNDYIFVGEIKYAMKNVSYIPKVQSTGALSIQNGSSYYFHMLNLSDIPTFEKYFSISKQISDTKIKFQIDEKGNGFLFDIKLFQMGKYMNHFSKIPKCEVAIVGENPVGSVGDAIHFGKRDHLCEVSSFGTDTPKILTQILKNVKKETNKKDLGIKISALNLILDLEEQTKSILKLKVEVAEFKDKSNVTLETINVENIYQIFADVDLENAKELQIQMNINNIKVNVPVRFHLLRHLIRESEESTFGLFKCSLKDISQHVSTAEKMNTSRYTKTYRQITINSLFNIMLDKLEEQQLNLLCVFIVELAIDFGSILPHHFPQKFQKLFEEKKQDKLRKCNPFTIFGDDLPTTYENFPVLNAEDQMPDLSSGQYLIECLGLFYILYYNSNFIRVAMESTINEYYFYEKMHKSHLSALDTLLNLRTYAIVFSNPVSGCKKYTWPSQLSQDYLRYFNTIINILVCLFQESPNIELKMVKLTQNNLEGYFGSLRQASGGFSTLNVKQVNALTYSEFAKKTYRQNKNTIAPSNFETIHLNSAKKLSFSFG